MWALVGNLSKEKADLQVSNERLRAEIASLRARQDSSPNTEQENQRKTRTRQRLEDCTSDKARQKLEERAAADIEDVCNRRFPGGTYGELSARAFALVLQRCPAANKDFLLTAAGKVRRNIYVTSWALRVTVLRFRPGAV